MERFYCPTVRAQDWKAAEPKINESLQRLVRMMNEISTGAGIPDSRLVLSDMINYGATAPGYRDGRLWFDTTNNLLKLSSSGTWITVGDETALKTALAIASQGALATLDEVTGVEINVANLAEIVSALGTQVSGILELGVQLDAGWRKIYDNTLTANATSVSLTGLLGNTDLHYFISCKWIKNGAALNNFGIQCNEDAGVINYGWHTIFNAFGGGASATGWNDDTWFMLWTGRADTDGYLSHGQGYLQAQSGKPRTFLGQFLRQINPAGDIDSLYSTGSCWWNTADELTSLQFLSEVDTGMKIGTRIEAWKRVD